MKDQTYDAPRAQRLNDAVRASGGPGCISNGSGANKACRDGQSAVACLTNGNYATQGCSTGNQATECKGQGNSAV
jgi:hypothetical protein